MKLLVIIMKLLDNWDENTSHDQDETTRNQVETTR